jgi:signal transduction histidine kinase
MILALTTWIERQQKSTLFAIALGLAALVWSVDYSTGPFLSVSIFYLIPIVLAAWWLNLRAGVGLSLLNALAWLGTDIVTNTNVPTPFIHYWNATVRLGVFLIVTYTLVSLRRTRHRQEELMSFVVHDLRSPLSNIITGMNLLDQVLETENETIQDLVNVAMSSGRRMLVQINSLLDLARLENGKLPV